MLVQPRLEGAGGLASGILTSCRAADVYSSIPDRQEVRETGCEDNILAKI